MKIERTTIETGTNPAGLRYRIAEMRRPAGVLFMVEILRVWPSGWWVREAVTLEEAQGIVQGYRLTAEDEADRDATYRKLWSVGIGGVLAAGTLGLAGLVGYAVGRRDAGRERRSSGGVGVSVRAAGMLDPVSTMPSRERERQLMVD